MKSISIGIFGMDEHGVSKNAVETYTFDYENLTFERSDRRFVLIYVCPICVLIRSFLYYSNRKYSDLKTQTSQTFNNLIESLSKMVPLSKGPYYLLFKMAHFEEFQPEEEGIQHFEPSTQSTHDESLFSISESVLSASFSSGSINSNFHQMSINIEAAMASNVKQDKLSSQAKNEIYVPSSDTEDEESENPGENQIKRKATRGKPSTRGKGGRSGARQPLGLLNIGKRMNNQDGEEDDGLPMPKRRVPYISQNEDEDD